MVWCRPRRGLGTVRCGRPHRVLHCVPKALNYNKSLRAFAFMLISLYSIFASFMLVIMSVASLVELAGRSTRQKSRNPFKSFNIYLFDLSRFVRFLAIGDLISNISYTCETCVFISLIPCHKSLFTNPYLNILFSSSLLRLPIQFSPVATVMSARCFFSCIMRSICSSKVFLVMKRCTMTFWCCPMR